MDIPKYATLVMTPTTELGRCTRLVPQRLDLFLGLLEWAKGAATAELTEGCHGEGNSKGLPG